MKIVGNLALAFALMLLAYPVIPNMPALRFALMRSNHWLIGPVYALFFVLLPKFLRLILASMVTWNLLALSLIIAIHLGGLDWIGLGRGPQYVLVIAACVAMAEITVLVVLGRKGPGFHLPALLRGFSPWGAWVLPLLVLIFAFLTLNPTLAKFISPWVYRAPVVVAAAVSMPIAGFLFVQWLFPSSSVPVTRLGP
jgi:hypothetical protein